MSRTMIRGSLLCAMMITVATSAHTASAQSGKREFVGTIGTLKIRMKLVNTPDEFLGSYLYERVGEDIRLAGAVSGDHTFYLNEFDVNGKATAKFEGRFVTDDWIEGTWASANGKKALPFRAWATGGKAVPTADPNDSLSGEYRRFFRGREDKDTSVLDIWKLKDGSVLVIGYSSWVGNAKTGGVNVGEASDIGHVRNNTLLVGEGDDEADCRFTIAFGTGALTVTKDNLKCGGLNVSFNGQYRKVGPPKLPET